MRELWAIKSECKSRRVIEIRLQKLDAVKQMEIGSTQYSHCIEKIWGGGGGGGVKEFQTNKHPKA
jgi:hypothetical protein